MDITEIAVELIKSLKAPHLVFAGFVIGLIAGVPLYIIIRLLKMIDRVFEHTQVLRSLIDILYGRMNIEKRDG